MIGATTTMIQAPSRNLATMKMATTMNDSTPEVPFTMIPQRQRPVRRSRWCLTMPAPAMVNEVNTPTA